MAITLFSLPVCELHRQVAVHDRGWGAFYSGGQFEAKDPSLWLPPRPASIAPAPQQVEATLESQQLRSCWPLLAAFGLCFAFWAGFGAAVRWLKR
jgi:hypothetical protein